MRTVSKPTEDVSSVFAACANGYSYEKTQDVKARLLAVEPAIVQAATEFDTAAQQANLHTILQADVVSAAGKVVTRDEMSNLYTDKMAKLGASGRTHYDAIKARPRRGICPLCGVFPVSTLDHYLPKKKFPALAVTPTNLVPSCGPCNQIKNADAPTSAEEQTLHPYYDDFTSEQWLYAEVVESEPPALRFSVKPSVAWDATRAARAAAHLDAFGLKALFASNAGSELVNIKGSLEAEFKRAGSAGIKQFLRDAATSRQAVFLNSWETATYAALERSEWFCSEGFRLIQ